MSIRLLRRRLMYFARRMGIRTLVNVKCALGVGLALYIFYLCSKWLLNSEDSKRQLTDQQVLDRNIPVNVHRKQVVPVTKKGEQVENRADTKMTPTTQEDIDLIAKNLKINYEVVSNIDEENNGSGYLAKISFTNTGAAAIKPAYDWKIYFYNFREVESDQMTENGVLTTNKLFIINYINGLLHSLTPTKDFPGLPPGDSISITYKASGANAARSDNLPNWYVAAPNTKAKVLASTEGVDATFVNSFDVPEKWKRSTRDMYEPLNPGERYDQNKMEDLEKAVIPIIPTPKEFQVDMEGDTVTIDTSKWVIFADSKLQNDAKYLSGKLGIKLSTSPPADCYIHLEIPSADLPTDESYTLAVNPAEKVILLSGKSSGIFYAIQSLLSLMKQYSGTFPKLHIKDSPRFSYRGVMLDVSRNFHPKETVLQLLDVMATYKLNKFHFHLTDDEGWRLEIPSIPELTEVGSKRGHDLTEESSILPQLGSGPNADGLGCGFYTVQDYKEILQYAADRHIEVVPEIDLPGHSHAAIKSMELRRKRYLAKGEVDKANEFLLSDPEDESDYRSVQGFRDNVINPGMESTFTFIQHIMISLQEMHKNIQPLKTLHFGGDEVPTHVWSKSPACRKIQQHHPKVNVASRTSIMEYFLHRTCVIASKLGLNIQAWEDAFYVGQNTPHSRQDFPTNIALTTNIWKNTWDYGKFHHLHEMANSDYKVVLSPATHLYLDHPYEPDPEDRGLYWATRFIDTKKVFNFQPDNFYDNIDVGLYGKPMDKETLCASEDVKCIPLEKPQNVIGMQAQLWTETVRTKEQLQEMLFPRLLALAERAWHKAPWESIPDKHEKEKLRKENYEEFSNTLGYKELERLESMGIQFHLPLPGVRIENGMLKVNTAHPGVKLQYSSNEGKTWRPLKSFAKLAGTIYITTTSYDGTRQSRAIRVDIK